MNTPWDGTNTRTVSISYADVWNDSVTRTTYAYPTTITDPGGFSSTVKYRYDIGANVEAVGPAPDGNSYGKKSTRVYDSVGRLDKNSIWRYASSAWTEHAYTRYEYPSNGIQSKMYSTLVDVDGDGNIAEDEVLTESWSDGAGRVRHSRVPHTWSGGSVATWAATIAEYDILGRVKRSSVPTEVTYGNVNDPDTKSAAGDDYARGFLWTYQKYDWMGRVVRKINTDGADSPTANDSDVFITYEGCGCAGGLVTTVQGPLVPRDDIPTQSARRTQRTYADILGRDYKAETYQWDGSTVYSSVVNTFNGRDQVTLTRQYAGTTSSTTYQDTTATFDGHARLKTKHVPQQDASTATVYNYNPDDSILNATDARGAVANFTYNSRGLLTNKSWTVSTDLALLIPVPASVSFSYDAIGNRTAMTDGLGSVAYAYNELSQMVSETRTFSDTLADKPAGNFNIGYTYALGGQLKSYSDPYGKEISYTQDKAGRLTSVTGTSFGGVTNYASNPGYRAWGGLKHLDYGSGFQMDATYNNRLQAATFKIDNPGDSESATFDKTYGYYPDGKLKLADESDNLGTTNLPSGRFDRSFTYDHMGRVKDAKSGVEAHGQTETNYKNLPYRQSYTYNAFQNLTGRNGALWDYGTGEGGFAYTITNNRVTGFSYDADGRQTAGEFIDFTYDAAGRIANTSKLRSYETTLSADGDGREAKRSQRTWNSNTSQWNAWDSAYFINSSVLGNTISETTATGRKKSTYVIAAGVVVAQQIVAYYDPPYPVEEHVYWQYRDASGLSTRGVKTEELDPIGGNVGIISLNFNLQNLQNALSPNSTLLLFDLRECSLDGVHVPCSLIPQSGEGLQARVGYLGSRTGRIVYRDYDFDRRLPGVISVYIPGSVWETDPAAQDTEDHIYVGSTGEHPGQWLTITWAQQQQDIPPALQVDYAITGADRRLSRNCLTEVLNLLRRGAERLLDDPTTSANEYTQATTDYPGYSSLRDYIESTALTKANIVNNLWNARQNIEYNNPNVTTGGTEQAGRFSTINASVQSRTLTLNVFGGFFREVVQGNRLQRPDASGLNYAYSFGGRTSSAFRETRMIHEGLHLALDGLSDELLGSILLNRNNVTQSEGSRAINDFIDRHCR